MKTIDEVLALHTTRLLAVPGVIGTAIGRRDDGPYIRVFVTATANRAAIPTQLDGYPVTAEATDRFRPM